MIRCWKCLDRDGLTAEIITSPILKEDGPRVRFRRYHCPRCKLWVGDEVLEIIRIAA